MKGLIRWVLNHLPRTLLQRIAGWLMPLVGLCYRGRRYHCPLCGRSFRRLLPYGYVTARENALCPHCLSLERHRLLWLYLTRETKLFEELPELLHIAPEVCLMRHLRPHYKAAPQRYRTGDLESPLADLHFDIHSIPLADESVDVVICNHLMEHVADDRQAMRELHRVLRRGGWGVLLSPVELDRATTFEDDSITEREERTRIFGQYDHRRIYGNDFVERLREAGFRAEDIDYAAQLTEEERKKYALPSDHIYVIHK